MKSSTTTLIAALRTLARDIQSDDGVANAAIAQAADRLELLSESAESLQGLHDYSVPMRGTYASDAMREWHKAEEVLRIIETIERTKK